MPEPLEEFIERLSTPLAEALVQFGYSFVAERESDTSRIFEFISADAPNLEVRIDK